MTVDSISNQVPQPQPVKVAFRGREGDDGPGILGPLAAGAAGGVAGYNFWKTPANAANIADMEKDVFEKKVTKEVVGEDTFKTLKAAREEYSKVDETIKPMVEKYFTGEATEANVLGKEKAKYIEDEITPLKKALEQEVEEGGKKITKGLKA